MAANKVIDIEMTSDNICPWCFLGYRRIAAAMDKLKSELGDAAPDFKLRFRPFLLDPTLTTKPENKLERYERKFGGAQRLDGMVRAMRERGEAESPPIKFSYGGDVAQTTDSHRLMELAYEKGGEKAQRRLFERMCEEYFEREHHLADFELLATCAADAGFCTREEALEFLDSGKLTAEVEQGYRMAQARGISGVPFFLFDGKYAVSGAQEKGVFVEVLKQLASGTVETE